MNEFLSIVYEWRFIIILVAALGLFALLEWEKFKAQAFKAMLVAKKMAKDKVLSSGKEQEEWVVKKLNEILPKSWLVFLSEDRIRNLVQYLYKKSKDLIDDGELNNSI